MWFEIGLVKKFQDSLSKSIKECNMHMKKMDLMFKKMLDAEKKMNSDEIPQKPLGVREAEGKVIGEPISE